MKIADKMTSFRARPKPPAEGAKKAREASRQSDSVTLSAQAQSAPVRFGTYNVAGGNKEKRKNTADEISPYAAQQITRGGVDVLALQEVKIFPPDGGEDGDLPRVDSNEEILMDTFRNEVGPDWSDADSIEKVSLDANGEPVLKDGKPFYDPNQYPETQYTANFGESTQQMTIARQSLDENGQVMRDENGLAIYDRDAASTEFVATTPNGREHSAVMHKESFDAEGRPKGGYDPDRKTPVQVYELELDNGKQYTQVFGTSTDHGYGNAVLLGPDAQLNRRDDGSIEVERINLGADPDGENRTALSVGFSSDGKSSTAVSVHLSNGSDGASKAARVRQYEELYEHTDGLDSVVVGGDFNSDPGGGYFDARWAWESPWRNYPDPNSGGLERVEPASQDIDQFLYGGEAQLVPGSTEELGLGGSDHEFKITDIVI